MQTGQRVAVTGMLVSGFLALIKITAGLSGHSTAVVADGLESAADVIASGFVLFGLTLAAKPADDNHPYGHGRVETLTGLLIGLVLLTGGALISWNAISRVGQPHQPLSAFVIWPLVISILAKTGLATLKFRYGRKLQSDALTADAWNDATDCISAIVALAAVALTLVGQRALRRGGPLRRVRGGADRGFRRHPRGARDLDAVDGYDARCAADRRDPRGGVRRAGSARGGEVLRAQDRASSITWICTWKWIPT